ncbi:MAG: hypothetical protein N4A76_15155 [Firmicutes bacterium]|jgi:predicted Abi (CAAX) family protease|nr:hypothetical protein [Bacillota bacterium]
MEYSAFNEMMSYFSYEFNIYIVLAVIMIVGAVKAIIQYIRCLRSPEKAKVGIFSDIFDIVISILVIFALSNAAVFQGVLSDIPVESGHVWLNKLAILIVVSALVFAVQLVFMVFRWKRGRMVVG